ncbi:MAG: outer membrane protein assembly factor, partial [Polyangiaceae bacterium]|nr:outer membrane protein assembly factor [Polyangiaceae bacterium]
ACEKERERDLSPRPFCPSSVDEIPPVPTADLELWSRLDARVPITGIYEGSQLADDLASDNPTTDNLLLGTETYFKGEVAVGALWDSRDREVSPSRGMMHDISVRGGITNLERRAYGGANITLRGYLPLLGPQLVAGARVLTDVIWGAAPFQTLAEEGGFLTKRATGGAESIRGVLNGRFHGKTKILLNGELRSRFLPFQLGSQQFEFGLTGFVDSGRVWSETFKTTSLDQGGKMQVGTGAGARRFWGESFVLRADWAISPTDNTTGFYITINNIF